MSIFDPQPSEQETHQVIERVEAEGGILRLLLADGSILDQPFPKKLQSDSDEEEEEEEEGEEEEGKDEIKDKNEDDGCDGEIDTESQN